jgi:hypothetical protein
MTKENRPLVGPAGGCNKFICELITCRARPDPGAGLDSGLVPASSL